MLYPEYVMMFLSPGTHSTDALRDFFPYFISFSPWRDSTVWNHRRNCLHLLGGASTSFWSDPVLCFFSLSESLLCGLKAPIPSLLVFLRTKKDKNSTKIFRVFTVKYKNNYQLDLIFKRILILLKDVGEELKPVSKKN